MIEKDPDPRKLKRDNPSHFNYTRGFSDIEKEILEEVNRSASLITPKEIALKTKIKHSTVRKTILRLFKRGFIDKVYHGHYASNGYSVTFGGSMLKSDAEIFFPKIHSIRFTVRDVDREASKWLLNLDIIRIKFIVYENGTAQVFIDCEGDYSFDYVSFRILVDRVLKELSVDDWDQVSISSPEWNLDYEGWKLDGVKALTLKAFDNSFRRIYNKKFGIRDEVKIKGAIPLDEALTVLQGGISNYNLLQTLYLAMRQSIQQNEHLDNREKFLAEAVGSMKRLADVVVEKVPKQTERIEHVEAEIEKLKEVQSSSALQQLKRQNLFMRICEWLNRDISFLTVNLADTHPLKRLGSWMNKEVIVT